MSAAIELQTLLRFLSQDAKVPLAIAIGKVKDLQKARLDRVDLLASAKLDSIKDIFLDEKLSKQIQSAAKRLSKKRTAGDDSVTRASPKKQRKASGSFFSEDERTPAEIEASFELPHIDADEDALKDVILITNRAPLVLAIAVTLLGYTSPNQPLSSKLSLAQAYVSVSSRGKAVSIGLESGKSAEEEGFGEGQPIVKVMGRDIRVLKRWGYEWRPTDTLTQGTVETHDETEQHDQEEQAVWALNLEALRKSNLHIPATANMSNGSQSGLPIHTPQSARAYLLKSFETAPTSAGAAKFIDEKKRSIAEKVAEKERNLGLLLRALSILFESWVDVLDAEELHSRANTWYFKVRPQVEYGIAGWGGKNELKLADILALKRDT